MAVTVRNILVGAGNLYINAVAGAKPALPAPSAGQTQTQALEAATATWRALGATQEGVEIGYTPDYGEVEVDQLKDAAVLFNQGVTVMMSTNLAEATLQNLLVAWGQPDTALVTAGNTDTFNLSVPADTPVERVLAVTGRAPSTAAGVARDRTYLARRVVSMEGSNHSIRRTEATVFPVSFRLLPDPTYSGSEYGTIIDRTVT